MALLNQIIALEKGIKSQEYSALSEWHKLSQKPELFTGFVKTYQKRDDDGEDLPSETKRIQKTVTELLEAVRTGKQDFFTITARKEWSNCVARADIRLPDGTVLVEQVPVTYLLFLEKQCTDLRTFIAALPTLDTNEDWTHDDNTGYYKTAPVLTHRTKKVQRPLVLYNATPEHPAQTQLVTEDIIAGYWSTVKMSSALPGPEKTALAERVETLIRAIKEAREAANSLPEVPLDPVARTVLTYLFG